MRLAANQFPCKFVHQEANNFRALREGESFMHRLRSNFPQCLLLPFKAMVTMMRLLGALPDTNTLWILNKSSPAPLVQFEISCFKQLFLRSTGHSSHIFISILFFKEINVINYMHYSSNIQSDTFHHLFLFRSKEKGPMEYWQNWSDFSERSVHLFMQIEFFLGLAEWERGESWRGIAPSHQSDWSTNYVPQRINTHFNFLLGQPVNKSMFHWQFGAPNSCEIFIMRILVSAESTEN